MKRKFSKIWLVIKSQAYRIALQYYVCFSCQLMIHSRFIPLVDWLIKFSSMNGIRHDWLCVICSGICSLLGSALITYRDTRVDQGSHVTQDTGPCHASRGRGDNCVTPVPIFLSLGLFLLMSLMFPPLTGGGPCCCCPPLPCPRPAPRCGRGPGSCCKPGGCHRPRSRCNSPRSRQFLKMLDF